MELVQSHYVILHEYWLGTTIVLFDLSTVDHTTYIHTCSCVRQKGRRGNNAIVRNQCAYTLHQNRLLSSVLPGGSPAIYITRNLMDMGELCAKRVPQCILLGPVPLIIQACGQDCTMLGS